MIATEKGLWALVKLYGKSREPVIVSADRDALETMGYHYIWDHEGNDCRVSFEIRAVSIDWPSLDPQEEEVICAKSAV